MRYHRSRVAVIHPAPLYNNVNKHKNDYKRAKDRFDNQVCLKSGAGFIIHTSQFIPPASGRVFLRVNNKKPPQEEKSPVKRRNGSRIGAEIVLRVPISAPDEYRACPKSGNERYEGKNNDRPGNSAFDNPPAFKITGDIPQPERRQKKTHEINKYPRL